MAGNILIVDDEPKICAMLRRTLESCGHRTEFCTEPEEGLRRLKEETFDLVITDLRMPGMDGLELLQRAHAIQPDCEIVLMTGHATVETAREALKRGALDYITKPIDIVGELRPLIKALFATTPSDTEPPRPSRRHRSAKIGSDGGDELEGFIGGGIAMQELVKKVRKIARSEAPVLLQGESGTGKEVVAGLLHRLSRRRSGPFIKINCAALPESLLESELFGHTKGAFTGANSDREGVFHAADGGTLLLDEIGEISRTFQPKLLRVLQDGEFHRVGDARRSIKVNVRVIAATNRNLPEAVRTGEFREDLYYRLNVVPLHMPPLRDRIEDLPELLDHFRADLAESRDAGAPELSFSKEATAVMRRYAWPGNIRELVNLVEYAMVLADGPEVTVADLPVALQDHERQLAEEHRDTSTAPAESGETLEGIEMHCIVQAMQKTGFNRTRAAGLLGVTRRTLGYRINKYKLDMKLEELRRASEQSRQTSVSTLH